PCLGSACPVAARTGDRCGGRGSACARCRTWPGSLPRTRDRRCNRARAVGCDRRSSQLRPEGAVAMSAHSGARPVRAPRGTDLTARGWQTEAPLRMLQNNLDPEVAEHPDELVVYGGTGKAARDWPSFDA